MKKIGFIGAYDKTDMLLNIAKILTTMQNKVLIVDSTINQKARYVVPAINPTVSYITSFEASVTRWSRAAASKASGKRGARCSASGVCELMFILSILHFGKKINTFLNIFFKKSKNNGINILRKDF